MTLSTPTGRAAEPSEWFFLGLRFKVLTPPGAPVIVSEATLPEGASPPQHVHDDLDDSFYLLEGRIVVHCGDEISVATPGDWVPFPARVPHTFRVMDGPARALFVHANDSFLAWVRELGRPAVDGDLPTTEGGPTIEELDRSMAAHGMTNVGPSMSEEEARGYLAAG